jgi:hypothetical protein
MPTLSDSELDAFFGMFKGEPGTRKSTQALTFPGDQYWFSVDKKMRALVLPAKRFGIPFSSINYDNYFDYAAIEKKVHSFRLQCRFKTIIIDSITSVADAVNMQTMELKEGTKTVAGDKDAGMTVGGIRVNTMQDYKAEASAFQQLIADLKDIHEHHHVNVVLIAHVIGQRKPEEVGEQTHFARIIVTGGKIISAKIPAYCDEVYHFNIESDVDLSKEGTYGVITRHTGNDYARTCLPLPTRIKLLENKRLYDDFIVPATKALKDEKPVTKI